MSHDRQANTQHGPLTVAYKVFNQNASSVDVARLSGVTQLSLAVQEARTEAEKAAGKAKGLADKMEHAHLSLQASTEPAPSIALWICHAFTSAVVTRTFPSYRCTCAFLKILHVVWKSGVLQSKC